MHGKRDQSRSVNVLRLAALTLVMPLRFIVHVGRFMCAHVCVFKWEGEQLPVIDWGRKRVSEDVTNFHWKFTSHCKKINKQMKKLLSLICTHIRIYCYDHKPSHKKNINMHSFTHSHSDAHVYILPNPLEIHHLTVPIHPGLLDPLSPQHQ